MILVRAPTARLFIGAGLMSELQRRQQRFVSFCRKENRYAECIVNHPMQVFTKVRFEEFWASDMFLTMQ